MRTASIKSTIPLECSTSYCSLVRTSIWTVTAEYGFYKSVSVSASEMSWGFVSVAVGLQMTRYALCN